MSTRTLRRTSVRKDTAGGTAIGNDDNAKKRKPARAVRAHFNYLRELHKCRHSFPKKFSHNNTRQLGLSNVSSLLIAIERAKKGGAGTAKNL